MTKMSLDLAVKATFHKLEGGRVRAVVTLTGEGAPGPESSVTSTADCKTAGEALSWATSHALDRVSVPDSLIHR